MRGYRGRTCIEHNEDSMVSWMTPYSVLGAMDAAPIERMAAGCGTGKWLGGSGGLPRPDDGWRSM
jgi:hypothetical protein